MAVVTGTAAQVGRLGAIAPVLTAEMYAEFWRTGIGALAAETKRLDAIRRQRIREGAPVFDNRSRYTLLEYQPGASCPPEGAFAYVWPDIFEAARANLRTLASFGPRPGTKPGEVLRWAKLINWNIALWAQATNIRERFLFPRTTPTNPLQPADNCKKATTETMSYQFAPGDVRRGRDGACNPVPQDVLTYFEAVYGSFWDKTISAGVPGIYPPNVGGDRLSPQQYGEGIAPFVGLDFYGGYRQGQTFEIDTPGVMHVSPDSETAVRISLAALESDFAKAIVAWGQTTTVHKAGDRVTMLFGGRRATWDVSAWVKNLANTARAYATPTLQSILLEAVGFYVWNHIPYWVDRGKLSLDPALLAAMQKAAQYAAVRASGATMIGGAATGLIAALGGPIAGAVAGVIGQLGQILLVELVGGAFAKEEGPTFLFLRSPAGCRSTTTAEELERLSTASAAVGLNVPGVTPPPTPAPATPAFAVPPQVARDRGVNPVLIGVGVAAVAAIGYFAFVRR